MAPNGPEKWGCRIRDLFSKIRDLFSKFETYAVIRDYETKKTAGAAEPPEPPSLAPMSISQQSTSFTELKMGNLDYTPLPETKIKLQS